MTVQLANDNRHFLWLSSDTKPAIAPNMRGATGVTLDTGERWIYDGEQWTEDLSLIHAITAANM